MDIMTSKTTLPLPRPCETSSRNDTLQAKNSPQKGRSNTAHTCSTCFRTFSRREHRIRHERCHTNEKPYECTICHRRYARQDLVARHETVIHGLERKYRKGPRPREKNDNLGGVDDISEESPTESQQDSIEPNIDPELQSTQNQGTGQDTTKSNTNTAEYPSSTSLRNNIDPELVDTRLVEFNNGPGLSIQHGDVQSNFEGIDMLSGLFNITQDPFLSNTGWYSAFNQQTSPDDSVDMAHPGWHPRDYFQFNDPVLEFPRSDTSAGSIKHVDSLPMILERPQEKPVAEFASEDLRAAVLDDLQKYIPAEELRNIELPRTRVLQKCLRSYIKSFHCHFPILHITQILGCDTPSPLRLAICSIGALYLMDRKHATLFKHLNTKALRTDFADSSGMPSLWAVQSKLLLTFFNAFNGKPSDIQIATEDMTFLQKEFRLRIQRLRPRVDIPQTTSWPLWRNREASKRLLFGILILGSLMSITYDLSPGVTMAPGIDLELPEDEALWEASSEDKWQATLKSAQNRERIPGLKAAWNFLAYGKGLDPFGTESTAWSTFSILAVIHLVINHMWYLMQTTQYLTVFAFDPEVEQKLRSLSDVSISSALGRCYQVLTSGRPESDRSNDDPEGPMIFNCLALLRVGFVRTSIAGVALNQIVHLTEDGAIRSEAIQSYVHSEILRSAFVPAAVQRIFQAICLPLSAGHILTKKTAAFTWSIEHAISGWECALYFTKWIHVIETQTHGVPLNPQEQEIIDNVRNILFDVDGEWDGTRPMAPAICRFWAGLYDDTWVWEVTRRMGSLLRELGSAFEAHATSS
ncbi:hypothetical protein N431DRAFT_377638 [Stipitochalara longipes BDJ]|nr:hypothetical protein N431DRAFT_377638 [Stipitochalara longipes BDJ]